MRTALVTALMLLGLVSPGLAQENRDYLPSQCGEFEVSGILQILRESLVLSVYSGSQSEVLLKLPSSFRLASYPYLHRTVVVRGLIQESINVFRGKIEPREIRERVPDPIRSQVGNAFRLLHQIPCVKTTVGK